MVQLRSEKMFQADRENAKGQLQTFDTKIQRHLDLTKRRQEETGRYKQGLQEEAEDEEDGGDQQTLAIKKIEEQSRPLEADQVSCGVMFL